MDGFAFGKQKRTKKRRTTLADAPVKEESADAGGTANWQMAWRIADDPTLNVGIDEEVFEAGTETCPICDTPEPPRDDGNGMRICCGKCGFVFDNIPDDRPDFGSKQEMGSYTAEPSRVESINPLMPHASMNTDITFTGRLGYWQYQMIKLNRWSSLSPMERSLYAKKKEKLNPLKLTGFFLRYVVFNKLEKACTRHRIPSSVQYSAKWLFKRVYECNMDKHSQGQKREGLRGTKRDGLIAACVYMAFKSVGLYWTKTRVAQVFDIDLGEIRRGLTIFHELVKDQPALLEKVTGCKQYINWFSVGLGLSRGVSTLCCKLFKNLSSRGIGSSKQPQSIAAGCLWIICQELVPEVSIDKLVHTTGISRATIKEVLKIMGGVEKFALLDVFSVDMCEMYDINNALTRNKIRRTCKALYAILSQLPKTSLWNISCFAIYFVLTVNNTKFNETLFLHKCKVPMKIIIEIARYVVPYRDNIISIYDLGHFGPR